MTEEEIAQTMALHDKADSSSSDPRSIGIEGHVAQVQDMIDAVREGRDPMVTGEQARAAVDLILAIYESARTGKQVQLGK